MHVGLQRTGMGDKLQSIVEAAVGFDVSELARLVEDAEDLFGLGGILSSVIHLQLHPHVHGSIPVKDRHGFIAVAMDGLAALVIAG